MRLIDIPAWIFNVFNMCGTARYALAYKGIPFRTEWVGWADIEVISRALGATPTGKKASGGPFYTVPMIYDPNTGEIVSDSLKIAIYLDNTYPSTPVLIAVLQNKPIDQYTPSANTAETSGPLKMAFSYISRPLVLQICFFKTYWEWAMPASHLYH